MLVSIVLPVLLVLPLLGREGKEVYGMGLAVDLKVPESELLPAVQEVVQNGTIQGSKEYNKDKHIEGAVAATSSPLFPAWSGSGKVFYKIREHALDPRNFKESNDVGTLAVRYVVENHGEARTTLRIDAVFVEDFRHRAHPSNGTVEVAEFKQIQDLLDKAAAAKRQAVEAANRRQAELALREAEKRQQEEAARLLTVETSPEVLEQRIRELRREVERRVSASGAELKSAPYQSASTLKSLRPGAEVVILISTPYWYGVETEDGQHGWIPHQQLELLP